MAWRVSGKIWKQREYVSQRASDLIASSRRSDSISKYESSWRKWICWCDKQKVDPISCNINLVLDFLTDLFQQGYEYSTICSYRSTISVYQPINVIPVGKQPKVTSLIIRNFNKRPPQPRYTFIWDTNKVF